MSALSCSDFLLEIARYRSPSRFQLQAYEEAGRRLSAQEAEFFSDDSETIGKAVRRCIVRQLRLSREGGSSPAARTHQVA
jgi:hypothetical protein